MFLEHNFAKPWIKEGLANVVPNSISPSRFPRPLFPSSFSYRPLFLTRAADSQLWQPSRGHRDLTPTERPRIQTS
jgi:hypothetical protein